MVLGMFMPGSWRMDIRRREKEEDEKRLKEGVFEPWHDKIKWKPRLNIQGSTFKSLQLFDVTPKEPPHASGKANNGQYAESPGGRWRYTNNIIPRGTVLKTWHGSKIGDVMFDQNVVAPAIYERARSTNRFQDEPWMSLTPAEVMSLRGGTRLAKGHTVVAGLGLGHQLLEVCKRKKVSSVTLVEISQELVDWLMPVLAPHIAATGKEVKVVVGDAMKLLPNMGADVALVDIFDGYGGNSWDVNQLRSQCFAIDKIWGWGTASIPDHHFYW